MVDWKDLDVTPHSRAGLPSRGRSGVVGWCVKRISIVGYPPSAARTGHPRVIRDMGLFSPTILSSSRICVMKNWVWFIVVALWLGALLASRFDFAVSMTPNRWIPFRLAKPIAETLIYFVLYGWLVPLSIGFLRLFAVAKNAP